MHEQTKQQFNFSPTFLRMQMHTQEVVFDEQVYAIDGITPEIEHEVKTKRPLLPPLLNVPVACPEPVLANRRFEMPKLNIKTAVFFPPQADGKKYPVMGSPIQLSAGARALPTKGAPALGADTEAAFAKYGKK